MPAFIAVPDSDPQDKWLSSLANAEEFARWVLIEVAPWLGGRILEVGCGIGTYTRQLAASAAEIVALDKNADYIARTASSLRKFTNVKTICDDALQLSSLKQEPFDTILLLDVLEHIQDDIAFLTELSRELKGAGYMVLKVPAGKSLYSSLDTAIGHYRRYDPNSLESTLRLAGLEVVRMWRFNSLAAIGWWWNGRIRKRSYPRESHIRVFKSLVPVLRRVDRYVRCFGGISIIAIARRRVNVSG